VRCITGKGTPVEFGFSGKIIDGFSTPQVFNVPFGPARLCVLSGALRDVKKTVESRTQMGLPPACQRPAESDVLPIVINDGSKRVKFMVCGLYHGLNA